MFTVYQNGSNTSTNGTALSENANTTSASQNDLRVFKMIVGLPVAAGNIWIRNISNPIGGSTANIALKVTFPASLPTTGAENTAVWDFGPEGLPLPQGGNLEIDQTMQVTLICGNADDVQ